MKQLACPFVGRGARLLVCLAGLAVVVACGRDAARPPPAASELYRSDIASLCDVLIRSGADQMAGGDRTLTTAKWLAANLQTQEARDYLVGIQPLGGEPKAVALDAEARRAGLASCALADEWRRAAQP